MLMGSPSALDLDDQRLYAGFDAASPEALLDGPGDDARRLGERGRAARLDLVPERRALAKRDCGRKRGIRPAEGGQRRDARQCCEARRLQVAGDRRRVAVTVRYAGKEP